MKKSLLLTTGMVALSLLLFHFCSCQKNEGEMNRLPREETTPVQARVEDFSPEQWEALFRLQQNIMHHPGDVHLRQDLCQIAYQPAKKALYVTGVGALRNPTTGELLPRSLVVQAATLDAQRWAGYIQHWVHNNYQPDFGTLTTVQSLPLIAFTSTEKGDSLLFLAVFRLP